MEDIKNMFDEDRVKFEISKLLPDEAQNDLDEQQQQEIDKAKEDFDWFAKETKEKMDALMINPT